MKKLIGLILLSIFVTQCSDDKMDDKGFQIGEVTEDEDGNKVYGIKPDATDFETRPRNVLSTSYKAHRVVPIYKVNYDKKSKQPFTGSNSFHSKYWNNNPIEGHNFGNNFMPGFSAIYGYNFVNISHFNSDSLSENLFFDSHVLIKTFYYPAFSKDTLNHLPLTRDYYMVSVYDEDTNKDGFVSVKDLRRFYRFDLEGKNKTALIPLNYSVMSSEYDIANDIMYVFAKIDANNNGQMESNEATQIFWVDLENPKNTGVQYKAK